MTQKTSQVTTLNTGASAPAELLAMCKASADPLRLDILRILSRDSFGVLELCTIFDCRQSGMSHHLKILANAGMVTTRREGNSIFYRRVYRPVGDPLQALQQALYSTLDEQPLAQHINTELLAVQSDRAASSQQFFTENAYKFRLQQEQVAAYELYGPTVLEMLVRCMMPNKLGEVLEVGPGEGAFLAELATRFQQVYALDNAQQMLDKARQLANVQGFDNIQFIHGDTKTDSLQALEIDCAVINMVLHHTPSPAEIFMDLAQVLKPGGQLFVTELCHHDQDWVRDSCGDLWLGFEPEDLSLWAEAANFDSGEKVFLAQRNGFRVQLRQFIRR